MDCRGLQKYAEILYITQLYNHNNLIVQIYTYWSNALDTKVHKYIDANKLSSVRRDIIRNKRLTDA